MVARGETTGPGEDLSQQRPSNCFVCNHDNPDYNLDQDDHDDDHYKDHNDGHGDDHNDNDNEYDDPADKGTTMMMINK